MYEILEEWQKFVSGKDNEINYDQFNHFDSKALLDNINDDITFCKGWDSARDFFSDVEFKRFIKLAKETMSQNFLFEIMRAAEDKKPICISSIKDEKNKACSSFSIFIDINNIIRFVDENETFYICQRLKINSGFYFPKRKLVISFGIPLEAIHQLNHEVLTCLMTKNHDKHETEGSVYGVIIDFNRPYHYFYDIFPFLDDYMGESKSKNLRVVHFDSAFFDIASFYDLNFSNEKWNLSRLNDYLFENRLCCVTPGYPTQNRNKNDPDELNDIDLRIRNFCSDQYKPKLKKFDDYEFKIWIGLSSEKRKWIEQEEALKLVIDYLKNKYKTILIVVDGLTATIDGKREDILEESSNELRLLAKLQQSYKELEFVNLIGAISAKKIAFASIVDFFICDFLTDSMWCARFGRKPGIGYGSSMAREMLEKRKDHVHTKTFFIDQTEIKDILHPLTDNWARQSISMNPTVFFDFFINSIESINSDKVEIKNLRFSYDLQKVGSNKLVVFLPSRTSKPIYPYYPRLKWRNKLNVDTLFLSDPFQNFEKYKDVGGSWYIDSSGQSRLPEIAKILNEWILDNNYEKIIFYGSSMGGYAAIVLSSLIPNSVAIAEAPQIYLEKYPESKKILERFCLENSIELPSVDKILCDGNNMAVEIIVNVYDSHSKIQVLPLMNKIMNHHCLDKNRIDFHFYKNENYARGHSALSFEDAWQYLRKYIG